MMRAAIFFILAAVSLMRYGAAAETDFGDMVFPHKTAGAEEVPPAVFPHWVHRISFKCYVCHDAIFQMRAGASSITMEDMQQGKFCGACHNGKIAFPVGFDTCDRCHHQ